MNDFETERGYLDQRDPWQSDRADSTDRGAPNADQEPYPGENILLRKIEYQYIETEFGRWRRFMGSDQKLFEEFRSHASFLGLPLLHFTRGRNPETGRRITACGIIAIGRFAIGGVAIGQVSAGLIAIGQLAIGLLFGLGQGTTGAIAIGQFALGVVFCLGQFAVAWAAIGQFAFGEWVIAQLGFGSHVLDTRGVDPQVLPFFRQFLP